MTTINRNLITDIEISQNNFVHFRELVVHMDDPTGTLFEHENLKRKFNLASISQIHYYSALMVAAFNCAMNNLKEREVICIANLIGRRLTICIIALSILALEILLLRSNRPLPPLWRVASGCGIGLICELVRIAIEKPRDDVNRRRDELQKIKFQKFLIESNINKFLRSASCKISQLMVERDEDRISGLTDVKHLRAHLLNDID